MFLREVKVAPGRCYLRLVESYRQGDKVKQRVITHLGRKDLLAPHLDSLVRLLESGDPSPRWVAADQVSENKTAQEPVRTRTPPSLLLVYSQ